MDRVSEESTAKNNQSCSYSVVVYGFSSQTLR